MNVERKKWYHKLLRPLLNAVGALQGVSGCGICGDKWNWKRTHNVEYSFQGQRAFAFPTCEECWQTQSENDIVRAAHWLAALWVRTPFTRLDTTEGKAEAMIEAVRISTSARSGVFHSP